MLRQVELAIYRVKLTPLPIVIDTDDQPVPNSHVIKINFPGDAIETALGKVNTIVGPRVAKIIVDDTTSGAWRYANFRGPL